MREGTEKWLWLLFIFSILSLPFSGYQFQAWWKTERWTNWSVLSQYDKRDSTIDKSPQIPGFSGLPSPQQNRESTQMALSLSPLLKKVEKKMEKRRRKERGSEKNGKDNGKWGEKERVKERRKELQTSKFHDVTHHTAKINMEKIS